MRSRKRLPAAFSGVGTTVRCKVAFFFWGWHDERKSTIPPLFQSAGRAAANFLLPHQSMMIR